MNKYGKTIKPKIMHLLPGAQEILNQRLIKYEVAHVKKFRTDKSLHKSCKYYVGMYITLIFLNICSFFIILYYILVVIRCDVAIMVLIR